MQVDVDCLEESGQNWNVRIKVLLTTEELSLMDYEALKHLEDFNIEIKAPIIYFNSFLSIAEPWEDEPLEELINSIKLEVEYRMKILLA
ncbi:hypothetical protein [Methanobacterium formicicum]|uniref:Uncharacterized protein n=1 Tax=Methanobacterium formicicum (strain DSM 3637 / PP1) TaxID=1204725 RepID=K2QAJ6_METFP|nr:hypothetical protein [Methanobacterium formicicum]EKF84976.1 hypothetical protein A994_11282 [Methanobacterium formicicum DSM 3637]